MTQYILDTPLYFYIYTLLSIPHAACLQEE